VRALWCGVIVLLVGACQEQLAMQSQCPDLCPGEGLLVRDTVLLPIVDRDSTYVGYIGQDDAPSLLISTGIAAGEARSWATIPARPDSVFVLGVRYAYTIDSAAISVSVLARDTAVRNVYVVVHRVPVTFDSTTALAELDSHITPETVVDSLLLPDTLRSGDIRIKIGLDRIPLLEPDETDSTLFGIAFRISSPVPTGVRLGSNASVAGGPAYFLFVQAPTADTTLRKQVIQLPAEKSNYVHEPPATVSPDNLFLGGKYGSRTILRFSLPRIIKDSGSILRATLELTPVVPIVGLPNDPAVVHVRAVLVDVGAKSPAFSGAVGVQQLPTGSTAVQIVEVGDPVSSWLGAAGLSPALLLAIVPEGGTFSRPEFFSSRGPTGVPRLRITYALSSYPGFP